MIRFVQLAENLEFFFIFWILCFLILFIGSFRIWMEYNWIFGFFVLYIIFYPIYKRWDKYFNGITLIWPSFWISLIIISSLILCWMFLFVTLLPNILNFLIKKKVVPENILENKIIKILLNLTTKNESQIKQWSKKFSLIWSSWVDLCYKIPFSSIPFMFFLNAFLKNLNTRNKKLWFFGLTLLLPRILILFALFYDIYIEKQLYWSSHLAITLTISILIKMLLLFVEKASTQKYDFICSLLTVTSIKTVPKNLNMDSIGKNEQLLDLQVIPEIAKNLTLKSYNRLMSDYVFFGTAARWCDETKELLNNVFNWLFLLFITLNLYGQITILLTTYH